MWQWISSWLGRGREKSFGARKISRMAQPYSGRVAWASWTSDRHEQVRHYTHWTYVAIRARINAVAQHLPNVGEVVSAPQGRKRHLDRYRQKSLTSVRPDEDLEPVGDDHPLVRLLSNPNGPDCAFALWEETVLYLDLTGSAYWWLCPDEDTGQPAEIWVLPSHWVYPIVGGDNFISEYEVRPATGFGIERFPASDVIHFAYKNPRSKLDGYSPTGACARWIDSSESLEHSRWSQMEQGAVPSGILELDESYFDPTQDDLERIGERWLERYGGKHRHGRPIVLPPGEKFTPLSIAPAAMQYTQSAEQLRDMVLAAYGVPQTVAGISREMTFGSVAGTMYGFYQFAINPLLRYIDQVLTEKLACRYPGKLRVWHHDQSPVDPAQRLQELQALWQADALTKGRYCQELNIDPPDGAEDETLADVQKKGQEQQQPDPMAALAGGNGKPPTTPGKPGPDARDVFGEKDPDDDLAALLGTNGRGKAVVNGHGPALLVRSKGHDEDDDTPDAGGSADTPADDEDDAQERAGLIADILGGIYGDKALDLFDAVHDDTGEPEGRAKAWNEIDHPRSHGRFIAKNSPEAHAAAKEEIAKALKEKPTPEGLKKLTEHLSILTVKQLHDLKREHGLSASGATKAELTAKIADRLHRGRRGGADAPAGDYPSYAAGQADQRAQAKLREGQAAAPKVEAGEMSGDDVGKLLAGQHGNRIAGRSAEDLKDRWVNSERFVRMEVPIDTVTPATEVEQGARTHSTGPIVVDKNKTGMGRHAGAFGAAADILILDGKHRHAQAKAEGKKTIEAMVGEKAVPLVQKAIAKQQEQAAKVSAAVRDFAAAPDGTTLRKLKVVLPDAEVERIRDARKALAAGKPVPPEVLRDYPDLAKLREGQGAAPKVEGVAPEPVAQKQPWSQQKRTAFQRELMTRHSIGGDAANLVRQAHEEVGVDADKAATLARAAAKVNGSHTAGAAEALEGIGYAKGDAPHNEAHAERQARVEAAARELNPVGPLTSPKNEWEEHVRRLAGQGPTRSVLKNTEYWVDKLGGPQKKQVAAALAAGKPVPESVLRDYPDLAKLREGQGAAPKVEAVAPEPAAPAAPEKPRGLQEILRDTRTAERQLGRLKPGDPKADALQAKIRQLNAERAGLRGNRPAQKPAEKPQPKQGFDPSQSYAVDGKEPWEMSAREWKDAADKFRPATAGGVGHSGPQTADRIGNNLKQQLERSERLRMGLPDVHDPDGILAPRSAGHREVVQAALAAGKPVPPEVLRDYPDLAQQSATPPAEAAAKPRGKPAAGQPAQQATAAQPPATPAPAAQPETPKAPHDAVRDAYHALKADHPDGLVRFPALKAEAERRAGRPLPMSEFHDAARQIRRSEGLTPLVVSDPTTLSDTDRTHLLKGEGEDAIGLRPRDVAAYRASRQQPAAQPETPQSSPQSQQKPSAGLDSGKGSGYSSGGVETPTTSKEKPVTQTTQPQANETAFQKQHREANEAHAAWKQQSAAMPQTGDITPDHLPPITSVDQKDATVRRWFANPKHDGTNTLGWVVEAAPQRRGGGKQVYDVRAVPFDAKGERVTHYTKYPFKNPAGSGTSEAGTAEDATRGFNELAALMRKGGAEERPVQDLDAALSAKRKQGGA